MPASSSPAAVAVAVMCLLVVTAIPAALGHSVPSSNVTAVAAATTATSTAQVSPKTWWWSWRYKTLTKAVKAASALPSMTTLLAAVAAADLGTGWTKETLTIFAPTNAAFEDLLDDLGLTAGELLANKPLLVKVLSYHVVVGAGVASKQLTNNLVVATALADMSVRINKLPSGRVRIRGGSPCNIAKVTVPDIRAGTSVIHVIDAVLLPLN